MNTEVGLISNPPLTHTRLSLHALSSLLSSHTFSTSQGLLLHLLALALISYLLCPTANPHFQAGWWQGFPPRFPHLIAELSQPSAPELGEGDSLTPGLLQLKPVLLIDSCYFIFCTGGYVLKQFYANL